MKLFIALFGTIALLSISGCSWSNTKEGQDDNPLVVTSFYPLYFFTSEIAGENAEVINLAGASDVHDYSPSPQDMLQLHNAELVIYMGADLEPWADDVIPQLQQENIPTLAIADVLPLHKMNEEEHESEDEHHHGDFDPHVWLDPVIAQTIVTEIRNALIELDANHAEKYQAHAENLLARLSDLDAAFASGLAECKNTKAIISHDSFGYLARRYAFTLNPIVGISTMDEPSAQMLAELKSKAEAEGITHILSEKNNIQRFAETLAAETNLEIVIIDPLGKGGQETEKDYFEVMEENLKSLQTAFDCS